MIVNHRFVCNYCRKVGVRVQRKSKGKMLHFCSFECNVKLLEGNVRSDENDGLLQAARDQLADSKLSEKERANARRLRNILRSAALEATK